MNPQFPIYIVSKGRYKFQLRKTARAFEAMGVPFRIIVEEQERQAYSDAVGADKVLILDPEFKRNYDTCEIGEKCGKTGSGPARNFAWEHSISEGHKFHWTIDDNIERFYRFNDNLKVPVSDGTVFRCMEDFVLRYQNIGMAGPEYFMFIFRRELYEPFRLNTRIYSCNLIRNDLRFRWRGLYNEDTDLSLRILKAGWCTVLFHAFLQGKISTQLMPGGNTDEIYTGGTLDKSQMLERLHPDVTKVVWKYNRWHHKVNYRGFKQQLIRYPGVVLSDLQDDYQMELVEKAFRLPQLES